MKWMQRITALGLSALLAAGMALPALAVDPQRLEKNETVYVVLEQDGSVRSQTVSTHLHREGGFSGAVDSTILWNIENTQDGANFTQDGETLTWDTEGEDVYYKGETDRPAPIGVKITYSIDGHEAPLEELLGKSGRVTVTIELENRETATVEIDGEKREVCTPFVTVVGAMLEEGWKVEEPPHGMVKPVGNRQAVGFVCMPGVRTSLEGLLPEGVSDIDGYLLDQVAFEADVTDFTAPSIFILCATDAESLKAEGLSGLKELDGLDALQEDMDALDEGISQLLGGAAQLTAGAQALHSGTLELASGAATLVQGAAQLNLGAVSLRDGAQELRIGASNAQAGAQQLQTGAEGLSGGLYELQAGTGALVQGYGQLKSGSNTLVSGLGELQSKGTALASGAEQLSQGIGDLYAAAGPEGPLAAGAQAFGAALENAASAGAGAFSLPGPEQFVPADPTLAADPNYQALLSAYQQAHGTAQGLANALGELSGSYTQVAAGVQQVSGGIQALQATVCGDSGLTAGIAAYTQGVAAASAGATQLDAGLEQLGNQLPALTGGVSQLVDGSNQLSSGAQALSQGNAALADGAQRLAQGSEDLVSGTQQFQQGIGALQAGVQSLVSGSGQVAEGAGSLQNGLEQYNSQGISKLTGSLDRQETAALKACLEALDDQKGAYGCFGGTPDGAATSTRFIMKTAQAAEHPASAEEDSTESQPQEESLWDKFLGLFRPEKAEDEN
ncbi:hypothetical protein [Acutalibacter caecimuris]|uniref:hypothetical protein n=1 Tax=Acutalibacter caecimuris TaxID=3093657 RepID=UPI002AC92618|nr:hypothetical protein [Acutalibacter sp. M00118]